MNPTTETKTFGKCLCTVVEPCPEHRGKPTEVCGAYTQQADNGETGINRCELPAKHSGPCNGDVEVEDTRCSTHECDGEREPGTEQCTRCREVQAYWQRQFDAYGREEVEQAATYREDMIEAGRGRLLRGDE